MVRFPYDSWIAMNTTVMLILHTILHAGTARVPAREATSTAPAMNPSESGFRFAASLWKLEIVHLEPACHPSTAYVLPELGAESPSLRSQPPNRTPET